MKFNDFSESRPYDHRGLRQELAHETNNLAVYINGKLWKVWAGKGYADSHEERAYLNSMQAWADRKSAATGKKWTVGLTGAEITESNVKEVVSPMSFNDDDWYEINTETKTIVNQSGPGAYRLPAGQRQITLPNGNIVVRGMRAKYMDLKPQGVAESLPAPTGKDPVRYSKMLAAKKAKAKEVFLKRKAKVQDKDKQTDLNEFAPPGSSDGGNDGFSEDTLKRLAAQWWNGDEDPKVEQTLMSAGWEIGQDEGYDNGGAFVVQAGDINGKSYISWPAEELEGLSEDSLNEFAPGGAEGAGPYAYGIALKEMAELYAKGEFDLDDVIGMDTTSQNQSDAEEINSVADAFMNRGMEAGREAYSMVDTMVQEDMDEYLHSQGFNVDADIHAEYQNDVDRYNNSPAGQADKDQQAQQDAEWEEDLPTWRAAQVEIAAVDPKNQSSVLHSVQFDARLYNSSVGQLKSTLEQQLNKIKQSTPGGVIRITLGGKPTDIQGILAQFKQLSKKSDRNSDVTEDAPSDMIGGWTRAERESHFRRRKQDLLQDYALLGKVTTEVIRAINNEVFLTKEQLIDFYKQQITDPDLTALEYAHDNNIPSSGLLKGVLRFLLERGFSMFDIRKLMGKAAEQKKKEVAEGVGKDRQWSNKDMEKLRVATRDFDDILSADGPEAIKQELIKKRIKTKPMAGPKGVLPEQGVTEADYGADYQDKVKRLGQMAAQGERKTVWDPVKRVYKTVPVNPTKKNDVVKEFNGEYDDEAGMAKSNLRTMARAVAGLIKTINDKENLPEWAQEKIANAETMLVGVWDYLLSQEEQGVDPRIDEASLAQMRDYFNQPDTTNTVNARQNYGAAQVGTPDPAIPFEIQSIINKMHRIGKITPDELAKLQMFQKKSKLNIGMQEAKAVNPYAIGMATAMKSTGDTPPLKKSTIKKAHEIAKKIKEE